MPLFHTNALTAVNRYLMARLKVRGVSHLDSEHMQIWKFWLNFSIEFRFLDTHNTFYLIVKGLKNAFFMPLTPPLYRYSTILWQSSEPTVKNIRDSRSWMKMTFFLCIICIRQKVWNRMEIWSPNVRHFVSILRFVTNYAFYKAFYWAFNAQNCVFCCNVGDTRKNNIFVAH